MLRQHDADVEFPVILQRGDCFMRTPSLHRVVKDGDTAKTDLWRFYVQVPVEHI